MAADASTRLAEARQDVIQTRDLLKGVDWAALEQHWGGATDPANIVRSFIKPLADQFVALTATDSLIADLESSGLTWLLAHYRDWPIGSKDSFTTWMKTLPSVTPAGVPGSFPTNVDSALQNLVARIYLPLAIATALSNRVPQKSLSNELAKWAKLTSEAEALKAELDEQRARVDEIAEVAKRAALRAGLAENAEALNKAVGQHQIQTWVWLAGIVVLTAALLAFVGRAMFVQLQIPIPEGSWTQAANLAYFAARALGVSVLSFLLVVSVRNYRSERHNQVVNQHRCNALQTFDKFKAGTEGKPEHAAVLLQATNAIFGVQSTGFSDKEPMISTHFAELLQMVKESTKAQR